MLKNNDLPGGQALPGAGTVHAATHWHAYSAPARAVVLRLWPPPPSYTCGLSDDVFAMHLLHDPNSPAATPIEFSQFLTVDIRVGTVVAAEPFPEARKPAFKLRIDFGPGVGVKQSSAQITRHYQPETLVGRQVAAVVNFPPRQIGKFKSEVLTVGFADESGEVVLFSPDRTVPNGARLF
jgi:tRNA-binding protein